MERRHTPVSSWIQLLKTLCLLNFPCCKWKCKRRNWMGILPCCA
jgi:hypothetical protein